MKVEFNFYPFDHRNLPGTLALLVQINPLHFPAHTETIKWQNRHVV